MYVLVGHTRHILFTSNNTTVYCNFVPMVLFSYLFILAWHGHMKVISHILYTNIFNFDIDRDKKLVLDAHET